MWIWRIKLCVCFTAAVVLANEEKPSKVVKTASGPVRGYQDPVSNVYEFLDIPYATAPHGIHKFNAPLPAPVWLYTKDAVDSGIICPQVTIKGFELNRTMQENCLLASIFTPNTTEKNLPVVVYVHGGGFQIGYGNWLKPIDLVREHNIVAVTFNYRLGAHGFLCLGTEDIPGNAGMKDQVALLRWVKKNIYNFGGDPTKVTIAGYSAGSSSVELLMLSRLSKGLFNKVIPESGASNAAFAIQSNPVENAKLFAEMLKLDTFDNIAALDEFYKNVPLEKLLSENVWDRRDSTMIFSPCIERPLSDLDRAQGKEVFLDESPIAIMKTNKYKKVPVLYGFANMEGLIRVKFFDIWKEHMNDNFSDFLPGDLTFKSDEEKSKVSRKVKEHYFGDKSIDTNTILAYVDYFGDVIIKYPMLRSARLLVENGHDSIYLYEYLFVDEASATVPYTDIKGAEHCAQTMAIFGKPTLLSNATITEDFKNTSTMIRQIWANFIKTGEPVPATSGLPAWPPVSSPWSPHMSLDAELRLRGSLLRDGALFWEDIYARHYREPVPPPPPPTKHTEL